MFSPSVLQEPSNIPDPVVWKHYHHQLHDFSSLCRLFEDEEVETWHQISKFSIFFQYFLYLRFWLWSIDLNRDCLSSLIEILFGDLLGGDKADGDGDLLMINESTDLCLLHPIDGSRSLFHFLDRSSLSCFWEYFLYQDGTEIFSRDSRTVFTSAGSVFSRVSSSISILFWW